MVVIPAPYHLNNQIEFFWYADAQADDKGIKRVKLIPDGKHGLIFQHREGRSALSEENGNLLPAGFVYGQSSIPFINYIHDAIAVFGVFFKAHAVKEIFKMDADKISDGFVDLDDLAGFRINEVLLNLPGPTAIYHYLSDFFWKRLNSYGKSDKLIEDSILNIQRNISEVSTIQLYKEYNISKRQFQRRFKERAGIHLGMYIRVLKFQRSLQLLHVNNFEKLSDIAYSLGYADQSHFIREFKFFTGYTPKDVMNQTIVIPENAFASNPLIQTRRHIYF
jgi:AraC-like DNA-binding protein